MIFLFSQNFVYLQAHAASAVLNFSENCTPDILTPYLDGIVSKLLVLLQVSKKKKLHIYFANSYLIILYEYIYMNL